MTVLAAAAAPVVNEDLVDAAAKYFSEMRTPAVFIAGAALGSLFALNASQEQALQMTRLERWLRTLYFWGMFATFLLTTNTVVIATAAYVTTRNTQAYNTVANSAWELLHREFYYELATTRWSFEVSLLSFLLAVMFRVLVEFDLIDKSGGGISSNRRRKRMGVAALAFSLSLISHLISYMNSQLHGWDNLGALTKDVILLTVAKVPRRPLEFLSCALTTTAAVVLGVAAKTPPPM